MNTRHIAFFFAAASLSFGALAAPSVHPGADMARPAALQERAGYRLTADEAHRMRGTYRLDDGRELVVTSERSRLYAKLDGRTEQLVPLSNNTFVARDSRTRFTFNQVPFADEVVVTPADAATLAAK